MKYTLIALAEDKILKRLDIIRNYLYTSGFRYTETPAKDHTHITLAQVEIKNISSINSFKNGLKNQIQNLGAFEISPTQLINKEHKRIYDSQELVQKYPDGCSWIALLFNDQHLKRLAEKIIAYTKKIGIDTTYQYAKNIAQSQGVSIKEADSINYVADHMNICNYARLDRSDEAIQYFKTKFEGSIVIDKISLVSEDQAIQWTIQLSK